MRASRGRAIGIHWGKFLCWALLASLLLVLPTSNAPYAQVVTHIEGTTTAPLDLGTHVDQVGTTTNILGGTRSGDGTNLFHSFDAFTLGTGHVAHFMNNMQLPTTNIIARVLGGQQSTIDGTLRTNNPLDAADAMNFGTAHLWLVNPSGLLLGPNARVEVGGSVSMSTANYLRFEGQAALFDMLSTPASLGQLTVAPVGAFGFTGQEPPAPITVHGSMLQVSQGQSFSLVGGNITIEAGTLGDGTIQAASLRVPGGQLNLLSVGSPGGEVLVPSSQTGQNINGASFTTMGTVMLKDGATLDVGGQLDEFGTLIGNGNSGTVFVRGGQLVMDASTIVASTVGEVDGERMAVDIQVSQDVALTNSSSITTVTFGPGRGGDVQLTADTVRMENGASIVTATIDGDGVGGDVVLNAGTVSLMGGSSIQSQSQSATPGLGQGGNVTIQGLPGAEFGAAKSVAFFDGSSLVSQSFGSGEGGRVAITSESLTMDGAATIIKAEAIELGRGGDIVVGVLHAVLSGGATINTTTGSGDPNAPAAATVMVQGLSGEGSMADSVALTGSGSGIVSDTLGGARSGDVAMHAKTVILNEGAVIQTGTSNNTGAGGNVTIEAGSIDVSSTSRITSLSAAGDAGQVAITADALTLDNVSIATSTSSAGRGGDVLLNVGTVSLLNEAKINSSASEVGRAGDVTMNVGSLTLANHAEITSSSIGTVVSAGDAGNVTITSSGAFTSNASTIATNTSSDGRGGDVVLNVGSISLSNEAKINSSTSEAGRAGDITMNVGTLSLANGSSISSASIGTEAITNPDDGTIRAPGTAGNVIITATGSFTSDGSTVATSAEANHGGDVSITAHSVQLSNGTLITANSNAPLEVKETVLINGQLVEQVVGDGNAGNITVHSGSTFVMTNSSMTTEASRASGGQIKIITPEMVRVINGRVSTSVAGSATDTAGGNITIDPQFVVLQGGQIVAKAFAGSGGAIDIIAGSAFISDPASIVDASSTTGISGTVNIQSPLQNVGGELAALSQEFSSAAALLAQQCAARAADGKFSTFVVAAREGVPVEPGGFLASPLLTSESLGSRLSGRDSYPEFSTVTGAFSEYEARPIQLAKLGNACR